MTEIKLNLGGNETLEGGPGSPQMNGFINVDCRELPGVEIVSEISSLKMVKDESVDEIRASHIIEHVDPSKLLDVLTEWKRILRIGGILRIYTPDASKISKDYIEGKIDCEEFSKLLFGKQDYQENFHRCIFDRQRLNELVTRSGFEIISNDPRPNSYEYDLGVQARKL